MGIEMLDDETTLRASVEDGLFTLNVVGHPDSVVEIGEQLMWMSCSLRTSNLGEAGICTPSFRVIRVDNQSSSEVSIEIEMEATVELDEIDQSQSGACWRELFRNSLVVRGFAIPILNYPGSTLGLQLSLGNLLGVVSDSRLVPYMGKLFIKRFSTLLVAVKRVGDIIIWHVISNKDGSYIYYHDKRIKSHKIEVASSILYEEKLEELRHVVGWTSEADNFAGPQPLI